MRLPTMYLAILALAASDASAQGGPSLGSSLPTATGQAIPQAPVGHRQPTLNDLPPASPKKSCNWGFHQRWIARKTT